jgi:2'-hydroxyisoflavone reductase
MLDAMEILILGGTRFVGRHITEAAQARGHNVTLFHRGVSSADGLPGTRSIRGDREQPADLDALRDGRWDAVIDTSGYIPAHVRAACDVLAACAHYTFISTVSAYADHATPNADESYPLGQASLEMRAAALTARDINGENYGPLKAACEAEVLTVFGTRTLIVRPGLIVGPYDPTDRFTYWMRRMAHGGDVLTPDALDQTWQFIDARDLAVWTLARIEAGSAGAYNVTGAGVPARTVLETARGTAGVQAAFTPVDGDFMATHNLFSWEALPFFLPPGAPEYAGFNTVNCDRARADGLHERPLIETVRDTQRWDAGRGDAPLKMGLSAEREAELLALWLAKHS